MLCNESKHHQGHQIVESKVNQKPAYNSPLVDPSSVLKSAEQATVIIIIRVSTDIVNTSTSQKKNIIFISSKADKLRRRKFHLKPIPPAGQNKNIIQKLRINLARA